MTTQIFIRVQIDLLCSGRFKSIAKVFELQTTGRVRGTIHSCIFSNSWLLLDIISILGLGYWIITDPKGWRVLTPEYMTWTGMETLTSSFNHLEEEQYGTLIINGSRGGRLTEGRFGFNLIWSHVLNFLLSDYQPSFAKARACDGFLKRAFQATDVDRLRKKPTKTFWVN